jgi:RNA polymerase sigma-70 factor (ECF subfamily)
VLTTSLYPRSRRLSLLDDAQLMGLVQRDDTAAFSLLYDRHATAVYSVARRIAGSRAAAEDVTQETFVGFWRSRASFSPERGVVRGWLLTMARNRAIELTRRRSHCDQPFDDLHDEREAPDRTDDEVIRRDAAAALDTLMDGLPQAQRVVIELAYRSGLTQTQIAVRLNLPLGTVKGRMRLGLRKLGGQLEAARA